jgi:hypothetical protein
MYIGSYTSAGALGFVAGAILGPVTVAGFGTIGAFMASSALAAVGLVSGLEILSKLTVLQPVWFSESSELEGHFA